MLAYNTQIIIFRMKNKDNIAIVLYMKIKGKII